MLTLKNNLRLGLGISLLILFASSLASYTSIRNLINTVILVQNSNGIIADLESILSTVKDAETGQRGYLLTKNDVFLEPYYGSHERSMNLIATIGNNIGDNKYQLTKLNELKQILTQRLVILDQAVINKRDKNIVNESSLLQGKTYMDKARQVAKDMQAEEKRRLSVAINEMEALMDRTPIFTFLAALLAIIITLIFYKKVSNDLDARAKFQKELEETSEKTRLRISKMKTIAGKISNGKYSERIIDLEKDELGSLAESFNLMTGSLESSFKALEDKDWLQTGIAKLNSRMLGDKDEVSLAQDILEGLILHTRCKLGALYIVNPSGSLTLHASYGVDKTKIAAYINSGEGILGQVYASKSPMLFENIEEHNIRINLASAELNAKAVLVYPIMRGDVVIGVLELGALHQFPERKILYLNEVSNNISTSILAAQNRKKMQELLEETQAQTEELQAQTDELHAQQFRLENLNAELESQTYKLQASEEELKVQQEELMQSNQELEERSTLLEERNQIIQERNLEIQRKAEQLELSTKYKSEFLANMSHELRTPLNSILLLSKLMTESEDLSDEYTEYAEVIQSSGQGLLSLIDEILDLSKIESGKMQLEVDELHLESFLSELKSLFKPIAIDKNLDFEINLDKSAPATLFTDRLRLAQIIKNLLSNAFKFTSSGKVSLNIIAHPKSKLIQFDVIDTGIGIPIDKQELIFQAFQQADGSTRRKFGGTGLGLSISRELSKILKGRLQLESIEEQGSTFSLIIPYHYYEEIIEPTELSKTLATPAKPVVQKASIPSKFIVNKIPEDIPDDRDNIVAGDKVILIIEDDTAFAKTLLDFTRKRNYKGIVAVRGDVGIELAQTYLPLAILLDIQLPIKDGWEVMAELKSNSKTKPIPVHMMSALSMKKESLQKGAVDFIDKPIAFEQIKSIFEKLENALSKHPKKILIVEENEQHAMALSIFLANAQIQTIVVKNVRESIEALNQKSIDCVILDMGVPAKNAYETLETIKKSEGLENLPIIVFTGKNISKGEETRIKQYADSIIVKTAHSYQRILDETALFLHLVEEKSKSDAADRSFPLSQFQEVLKNKKVLIADDDVRNIFSITKALELHQMEIVSAIDGKDALKQLDSHPDVDIILMDMMMPEMDGYETIQKIRKIQKFKQLPILAVTAKAMMGDREKCIAAGASDYISKPIDFDQLISLLRVWLYK
ncbi:MAG: response regulator [Pedobacter sp.]|nr:MAG: response regulator [Pedobacter sp.]